MRIFSKIKTLRNCANSLSCTDVGKSCLCCEFFTESICLLTLFAKIKLVKISEFTVFSDMLCG